MPRQIPSMPVKESTQNQNNITENQENAVEFELLNDLGTIAKYNSSKKRFTRISWNGNPPKYDIRTWKKQDTKPGKGITLTEEELRRLKVLIDAEIKYLDEEVNN